MQRYFVAAEQFDGSGVRLLGEDAFHAVRVMRMKEDQKFIVSDGQTRVALAAVVEASATEVTARIVEELPMDSEPAWSVTIAQSLPKGDKMELVIQKGTEIGAYSFAPFQSERMIVQYDGKKEAKRLERWSKIAKEAAEQSHRCRVPAIEAVRSWRELIDSISNYDLTLFCYEREGDGAEGKGVRDALLEWKQASGGQLPAEPKLLIVVGPEGGFTEAEANGAETAGAVIVGLGKRILRTETAGIVGLTCLLYEAGEMGGA
ncbi:RsmE family RNA methyltransferase [Paenibacillus radicis (ex Gao et al. 2016)]|uniref:Ribosomal RNA small subunit methyltransferase E n=1 Tax=Paenibacillus radicis (ex Gao et al. 2016) TaxID=1737354 RepID=A0A917GSY8_9BACL|nr:RsmE family RNA methyltransferase [Paenibacillus radicis (ex Gao et al. 2016)]GGG56149.1 ribosomal RNA small subunit methyltransferase E [Paenibacillus radicis (ex Gao et al. 2016)]